MIVTSGLAPTLAAKAATTTIPIVFGTGADPVALGLVASLNRPGANLTGIANLSGELAPKQLQLLHEVVPKASRFGVLADSVNAVTPPVITGLQSAAGTLGLQLVVVDAGTDSDLETAFTTLSKQRTGAVLIGLSTFYNRRMEQLAALRPATRCPRSTQGASSPWPVV